MVPEIRKGPPNAAAPSPEHTGYARDMTELAALLMDNDVIGIALLDRSGTYRVFNRGAELLTGYHRDEVVGSTAPFIAEADRKRIGGELEANGCLYNTELRIRRKDGSEANVILSMTEQRDEGGAIKGYTQFLIDNTEKKHLQQLLMHSQRLEVVGEMAGGIAHDFNNLLEGILGYTTFMMDLIEGGHELRSYLEIIERSAKKASDLTARLLTFSPDRSEQQGSVDCNVLLREVVKLIERTVDKRIVIEMNLDRKLEPVRGAAGQLEVVFFNVCLNARDAMPEGGKLLISSENVLIDESHPRLSWKMKPGAYIRVSVSDTGKGMDRETKGRIFEPFFTTKKRGEGTGLGLNMVYGIVDKHDGFVTVYSEVGQGTVFNIYLPVQDEVPEELSAGKGRVDVPRGNDEVVLVIDDEPIIRDLSGKMLRNLGYEPLTAGGAKEGLEIFREHKDEIDLVILDVVMPHAGGREVLSVIRGLRTGVPVLLTSGYSRAFVGDDVIDGAMVTFIQKPYSMERLACEVRLMLDRKEEGS